MTWTWWDPVLPIAAGSAAPTWGSARITFRGMLDSLSGDAINAGADFGYDAAACHMRMSPFRTLRESGSVKAVVHESGIHKPFTRPDLRKVWFPIR